MRNFDRMVEQVMAAVGRARRSWAMTRRQQGRDAMQISNSPLLLIGNSIVSLVDTQKKTQVPSSKSQNAPLYSYLTHPGPTFAFNLLPNRKKSEGRLSPVTVQEMAAKEISLGRNFDESDKRFTRVGHCK
jgi:hypothetical protein